MGILTGYALRMFLEQGSSCEGGRGIPGAGTTPRTPVSWPQTSVEIGGKGKDSCSARSSLGPPARTTVIARFSKTGVMVDVVGQLSGGLSAVAGRGGEGKRNRRYCLLESCEASYGKKGLPATEKETTSFVPSSFLHSQILSGSLTTEQLALC